MIERCTNHSIVVFGSGANKYTVSVKDDPPTCTCPIFAIRRNKARSKKPNVKFVTPWCKHLEAQFNRLCRWRGEPLVEGLGLCPRCGSPTEEYHEEV